MEQIDQNQSMDSYKVFPSCLSEADSVLRPSDLGGFWPVYWYFPFTLWWFSVYVLWCLPIFLQSRLWLRIDYVCFPEGLVGRCQSMELFLTPSYVDSYDLARVSPSMVMHRVICMYIFFFSPSWWSHQVYKKNLLQCSRPQSPYVKGEYTWHKAEAFMDLRFYSIF